MALLDAAVALFASRGPASVTTRQIAEAAGVNLGLIHRHFGSKAALVAETFEVGTVPVLPAALSEEGFHLDSVVAQARHTLLTPRLIARTLVDGIDIAFIKDQYPVLSQS